MNSIVECTEENPCKQYALCMRCWTRVATLKMKRERLKDLREIKKLWNYKIDNSSLPIAGQGPGEKTSPNDLIEDLIKSNMKQIAKEIGLPYKTVTSWNKRGNVPTRYHKKLKKVLYG